MRKHADDYETVYTIDEKGNEKSTAVYRGIFFEIDQDKDDIIRFRRNCFILLAVIVAVHISGGFVANLGMYQFYIGLPYVLAFFPMLYLAMGIFRLPREKRLFRRDEIDLSFGRIKTTNLILLLFFAAGVIGELVFLLLMADGKQIGLETLYLAIEILAVTLSFILLRSQKQIQIKPAVNQEKL